MLSVRNGKRAIEFYKAAFGAGELFRVESESGAVVARLSVGKAEFWLADESPEHLNRGQLAVGSGRRPNTGKTPVTPDAWYLTRPGTRHLAPSLTRAAPDGKLPYHRQ